MKSVFLFPILGVLALGGSLIAQSTQPAAGEFSWHGELVALEDTARMLTVKSPVVGEQAPAEFGRLKAGERVVLTWSGFDKFADAINGVARPANASKSEDRFTFPAEFVSYDSGRRYATFKVQIPQNSIANLKSLKPGEWVTATSPHGQSSRTTPIVTIRPYVGSASTTTSE
jgi:hypothetical protein